MDQTKVLPRTKPQGWPFLKTTIALCVFNGLAWPATIIYYLINWKDIFR